MKVTAIGEILFDVYPDYKRLGGAPFNFLYHIWKLTGNGNFISRIGTDKEGREILKLLEKQKFDTSMLQIDENKPTGIVKVKLDENKIPDFKIVENRAYDYIKINPTVEEIIKTSDLFYFGSLAQRNEVTRNSVKQLAGLSKRNFCDLNIRQHFYNKEVIVNSLSKCDVVKLNSDELKIVNDYVLKENYELDVTASNVIEKFGIDLLCVTLGSEGALLFKNSEKCHYKENVKEVVDTVGAGDAYAALLAIGYLSDWTIEKINEQASKFSAEICKVSGALPLDENFYNKFRDAINHG